MLTLDPETLVLNRDQSQDGTCKGTLQSNRASGAEFKQSFQMYGMPLYRSAFWQFTGLSNDGPGMVGFRQYGMSRKK